MSVAEADLPPYRFRLKNWFISGMIDGSGG